MLCEECKINEATFTLSVMVDTQLTQRHLCGDCMAKMHMPLMGGSVHGLLGSILSAISGSRNTQGDEEHPPMEKKPEDDLACPCCGTTWGTFTQGGLLGCAGCYDAFREQLAPMLRQIHGKVQHEGRTPLKSQQQQELRRQQEELSREMALAVENEDYEKAARLRDQLRALAREEGAT